MSEVTVRSNDERQNENEARKERKENERRRWQRSKGQRGRQTGRQIKHKGWKKLIRHTKGREKGRE